MTEAPHACRFCARPLEHVFADLGVSPLANSFLTAEELERDEPVFPLKVYVCSGCLLVQLPEFESPENIFTDYAYFSSFADTWLAHVEHYAGQMTERFALGPESRVVEIASNDGHLLQRFKRRGIPVLGIEPAVNVAAAAEEAGVPTLVRFFGTKVAGELAGEGRHADLLAGNNVLAHVPDLNDFVGGMKLLLAPHGVITMEFPHLMRLMAENQFDTIYHEHFSYLSLRTVCEVFAAHGLTLFDVEELPTHGGSLRIFARHAEATSPAVEERLGALLEREREAGFDRLEHYLSFDEQARATRQALLDFLAGARAAGKSVVGYGAPAKGNTLLNYCGVGVDEIPFTVDRSPHKQGLYLPGTHLPIHAPEKVFEARPDYLLILAWNFKEEIMEQMSGIREWGGRFAVAVPEARLYD
jgi:2-polyprenyl-3-methyl-5-hydroxy-6-metoxy-1,4-benzoquinol methylase